MHVCVFCWLYMPAAHIQDLTSHGYATCRWRLLLKKLFLLPPPVYGPFFSTADSLPKTVPAAIAQAHLQFSNVDGVQRVPYFFVPQSGTPTFYQATAAGVSDLAGYKSRNPRLRFLPVLPSAPPAPVLAIRPPGAPGVCGPPRAALGSSGAVLAPHPRAAFGSRPDFRSALVAPPPNVARRDDMARVFGGRVPRDDAPVVVAGAAPAPFARPHRVPCWGDPEPLFFSFYRSQVAADAILLEAAYGILTEGGYARRFTELTERIRAAINDIRHATADHPLPLPPPPGMGPPPQ